VADIVDVPVMDRLAVLAARGDRGDHFTLSPSDALGRAVYGRAGHAEEVAEFGRAVLASAVQRDEAPPGAD
jgi:hypothetical protein